MRLAEKHGVGLDIVFNCAIRRKISQNCSSVTAAPMRILV